MAAARTHTELIAWQLCEELVDLIIEITASGPVTRDEYLCGQILAASGGPGPHMSAPSAKLRTPA